MRPLELTMNRQFVPDETEKFQTPHWLNGRLSKNTIRYTHLNRPGTIFIENGMSHVRLKESFEGPFFTFKASR